MDGFKPFIAKAISGPLSRQDAVAAFDLLLEGAATPAQIGGFLMALRARGETIDEIAGAVSAMRARMVRVSAPEEAIDIVGTGGDASGSYNVSTAAAFVAAGAGVKIAKHGNRALTSKSGSADVLTALGVRLDIPPDAISRCIKEAGLGFMFAPAHHGAMKHVGPTRAELGTRTVFNLLGPLSNPAGVRRQLLGAFDRKWLEPMVSALRDLGSTRVIAVHGEDSLDEITTTGVTHVVSLENGTIAHSTFSPEEAGLARARSSDLMGGDAETNAKALRSVLDGAPGAYRDITLMNAGAAMIVADKASTLREGVELARQSIDSGAARAALAKLIEVSNG